MYQSPQTLPDSIVLEHDEVYDAVMANHSQLVATNLHASITFKSMGCLKEEVFLNDECINGFLWLLQRRDNNLRTIPGVSQLYPKCHFMPTFFYNKLFSDTKQFDYNCVKRWGDARRLAHWGQRSADLIDCDLVIVPIHRAAAKHWVLAVINLACRKIEFYDSLHGADAGACGHLEKYIKQEMLARRSITDQGAWDHESPRDIPMQYNGTDCGVFMLMYAKYRSTATRFDFLQTHMKQFRKEITYNLMMKNV